MSYIKFFLGNKKLLLFGLLLTLFSSFGQTFLIALYLPKISSALKVSEGTLGILYAFATIASACILVFIGRKIDSSDLRKYSMMAIAGMCLSLLTISQADNLLILTIGLAGLRLTGQGLLGHISSTSMLRLFEETKGKALSITSLGYPIGQAVFPVFVLFLISQAGWRESMVINTAFIFVVLIPSAYFLLKTHSGKINTGFTSQEKDKEWKQLDVLKQKSFYRLLPGILIIPFLVTALFFYQLLIADFKGWSPEWIAFSYIGYAAGNFIFLILSGPLIDKFTATKAFPFYLIPFLIGLLFLTFSDHPVACFIYMTCTGISTGLASVIKSAIQAEVYGVKSIGAVKSLFTTSLVLSTALGPVLFGTLFNMGVSVDTILMLIITVTVSVIFYTFFTFYPFSEAFRIQFNRRER